MEQKLTKKTLCTLVPGEKWADRAAAWMGLSFFLRMVYYFGFTNLKDVPVMELIFSAILPLLISVAFILVLKLPKLTLPLAAAGLAAAFAVNYFFAEQLNLGGILSGVLVLAMAGLILAAVLGYIPERMWLLWAGMAALGFRVLFVDFIGYLLPLTEFNLIAYIPRASNLFGIVAIAYLSAALHLEKTE